MVAHQAPVHGIFQARILEWVSEVDTEAENSPGAHPGQVNPGCGGRDSDGFGWGSVPVVLPGVATAAGNALGARQGRG